MAVIEGFFICEGWVTRGEMYVNGSQIKNLPIQSDMVNGRRWQRPASTADVVKPARLVDTPTGQRFGYGGLVFSWPMQGLSPKMVAYLQNTYFATGSNFFERGWSNKLTVQTFNRASGEWETYHTYGRFPNLDGEAEPAMGGYNNFQLYFTAYKLAPEGADMDLNVTYPLGNIYTNTNYTFTVNATNIGDESTFDDVVFNYQIPENFVYVSATSSAPIVITYSINGGASYTGSPPMDLGTLTNIKIAYTNLVPASSTSTNISITLTPDVVSTDNESTMSVTTDGDGEAGDKSNSTELDIVAWIPTAVSGLQMWLNADIGVYNNTGGSVPAANGELVARWGDQSGNVANRYALQTVSGNRPTFLTGQANGHSAVEFDAGDAEFMAINNSAITGSYAMTVAFVIDAVNDDTAGVAEYLLDWPIGVSDQITFAHIDGSAENSVAVYRTTWALFNNSQAGLQTYTFINRNNVSSGRRFYLDGNLGTDFGSTLATVIAGAMLGSDRVGTAANFNGKIYEVVVYNTELTGQALQNLNDYITTKYGI